MSAARPLAPYVLPALLTMAGGGLLIAGLIQDRDPWTMFGAALAFFSGLVAFALQLGMIGRRTGMVIGLVVVLVAAGLAWRGHRNAKAAEQATAAQR